MFTGKSHVPTKIILVENMKIELLNNKNKSEKMYLLMDYT